MNQRTKKILSRTLLIAGLVVAIFVIDRGLGLLFDYARTHSKGGYTGRTEYINAVSVDSVYVTGSSRAFHHYDTPYMSRELGIEVYNAGLDGCGMPLTYMEVLNMINRGHRPKLIIHDLYMNFDASTFETPDYASLNQMRPYFDNPGMAEVFDIISPHEKYKMVFHTYRYNTKWLSVIKDYLGVGMENFDYGFGPLDKKMTAGMETNITDFVKGDLSPERMEIFERFLRLCQENDIELMLIVSPVYQTVDSYEVHSPIYPLLDKYGVEIHDYLNHPEFVGNSEYFADPGHLNAKGARRFTELILEELVKPYLKEQ